MTPTPAAQPDPPALDAQWLVHCSPERTLVARRQGADTVLVKIFEQGSLLEAQQETEVALALAQPGVVGYRSATQDPVTSKPCVVMDYCDGENVERLVAATGPLSPGRAAQLAAQLAAVLADFHQRPRRGAPTGYVHRDVKPANILLVQDPELVARPLLMDLEHVVARRPHDDSCSSVGFTGGTHGYAPPESYVGWHPEPEFDVFGLGATLFYLLTGTPPFTQRDSATTAYRVQNGQPRLGLLRGYPPALRACVTDSLATRPEHRPPMRQLQERLAAYAADRSAADRLQDRALRAIQAGDPAAARSHLQAAAALAEHDAGRQSELTRLLDRRERGLARLDHAPEVRVPEMEPDSDLRAIGRQVADMLRQLTARLVRWPHHEPSLAARNAFQQLGHRLLEQVLPRVARLKMSARFADALELLDTATAATEALHRVPGGLSLPTTDAGHLPGPLLRNPAQLLERARRDVERMANVHQGLQARLEAAEAQLDPAQAGVVIDEIAAIYGGASEVVAPLKDRLLRLDFYLQRIAWPRRTVDQLQELLELSELHHQLDRVAAFCDRCDESTVTAPHTPPGKGGVRTLLETMDQLTEDFPHAAPTMAEAQAALEEAMRSITEQAWKHLTEVRHKLDAVPIPIRPVQNLLNRLDRIRMLESFLDLPDRSRERLQDGIERVRMRLDQARTTRDNLARGAEAAMERGHLTTALFDMARAVDSFEDEPEPGESGDSQLSDRLEEAKRRKQALEHSIVENHRLAARYLELVEDPASTMASRLDVLEERAQHLDLLIRTLGLEKGAHYATDLREVMLLLLQEKADQGERQIDRATDPADRLRIARETLGEIRTTLASSAVSNEAGGRIRNILDHWQHKEREIHAQLQQETTVAAQTRRERRRSLLTWSVGVVVLVLSVFGTMQVVYGSGSRAPDLRFTAPSIRLERNDTEVAFASGGSSRALLELSMFVARLKAANLEAYEIVRDLHLESPAARLLDHLANFDDVVPPDSATLISLTMDLAALDRGLALLDERSIGNASWRRFYGTLTDFGRSTHLLALSLVVQRRTDPELLETLIQKLAPLRHLALEAEDLNHLRRIVGK